MRKKFIYLAAWGCSAVLWLLPFRAQADFVIEFVDGRQVTVGHYFAEGTMIKIYTPQGSIGFPKAEVKRILSVDTNGAGVPLETVSLHGPTTTESAASPTQPGEKNADRGGKAPRRVKRAKKQLVKKKTSGSRRS